MRGRTWLIAAVMIAAMASHAFAAGTIDQVQAAINKERAKHNLPPVRLNAKLTKAARGLAVYMAAHHVMSHEADGRSPGQRITAAGYRWSACGEIICHGPSTAAGAVKTWMNSPGHRAIILNKNCPEIGVGSSGGYWAVDFARPR